MTTIIVVFRNFSNAPYNVISGTNTVLNYQNGNCLVIQYITSIHQKVKAPFFYVINKTSQFDKHGFSEHDSLVSAVARSIPFIFTNPNNKD